MLICRDCGYGTLSDELIRDRIVVGIKDREVSEKLQMKEKLTLDDAMTMARQQGRQDSAACSEQGAQEKRSSFGSHRGEK